MDAKSWQVKGNCRLKRQGFIVDKEAVIDECLEEAEKNLDA